VISSIEVQNFKGFRDLKLSGLGPFHVLVGANGSGKSSFFEVFEFIKDLMLFDVREAVSRRNVSSLRDLTFDRLGGWDSFNIAIDDKADYILSLYDSADAGVGIAIEHLPVPGELILLRDSDQAACYTREDGSGGDPFSFSRDRTALAQVPQDEKLYPTANRVKKLLSLGVQSLSLDSRLMGTPCPPSLSSTELLPDGRNLATVAGRLLKAGAEEWTYHLKLALEDLGSISWRQREDDRAEYLILHYRNGLEIPAGWRVSERCERLRSHCPHFSLQPSPGSIFSRNRKTGFTQKPLKLS